MAKFVYDRERMRAAIARKAEEYRRTEESRCQNPWNKLARLIVPYHADTLTQRDHGFVTSLVNRSSRPSKGELSRLKAIADRLGIQA